MIAVVLSFLHQFYFFQQATQEKLKQAHNLAEMYREQCVTLESQLAQIREESDVGQELYKVPPGDGCVCGRLSHTLSQMTIKNVSVCRSDQRKCPNVCSS